jgi:hypothetical protein
MDFGSIVGKLFRSGPPTQETTGEITSIQVDPLGDGKSASFRLDSMPDTEFRQRPNTLSSVHRRGERVKVVYSLASPGVATVDWVEKH